MPLALRCELHAGEDGTPAARIAARDWPWAVVTACAFLALGLPTLGWAAVHLRAVEGGGAAVFTGIGLFVLWLGLDRRRDVSVLRDAGAVRVRGHEGAWPFAKPVDLALPADAVPAVVAFDVPEGAPDLSDRGGDLFLSGGGVRVLLARRVGPGWREDLDAASLVLRTVLSKGDGARPAP